MKISISEIIGHFDAVLPIDVKVTFDDTGFLPAEISFISPISLKGSFINNKTYYSFKGSAVAALSIACARCLEDIYYIFNFDVCERFVNLADAQSVDALKNNDNEYDELYFFEGGVINMADALVANCLLNLPSKVLCSDNCKGLCITCGINLNKSECGCGKKSKNSVFDDLNGLFDND